MSINQNREDLDAFLTTLEAKMRGPYSSLDLAKIVSTHSLRGSLSPAEYLTNVSHVLSRTDKLTQLRTLVGLLGLEPTKETDPKIYDILTQTQEAPLHEEWVRVVAGLVRGILFVDRENDNDNGLSAEEEGGEGTHESCRGEEAKKLLDRTCKDIVQQTRQLEIETEASAFSDQPNLESSDMYPLFVSYRYSLLDPELLDRVIPEHMNNPHFQVNLGTNILGMDDKIEQAKADEAQASKQPAVTVKSSAAVPTVPKTEERPKAVLPGSRVTKKLASTQTKPKANMFMPTKRPVAVAGRGGRAAPMKTSLHTRKAGAAQSLLGKKRHAMGGVVSASTTTSGTLGRAQKLANNKSRMKMIDVTEVQGLNKEHKQRENQLAAEETKESRLLARKRKIMEAAAEKGLVAGDKLKKLEQHAPKAGKSQQILKKASVVPQTGADNIVASNDVNNTSGNQEWQVILQERSNKLSTEDRMRVQQFFVNKYNPTPDQLVYKMKLHEERTRDPTTGQEMKNTYYLELDYSTFTSKQSKKTKHYD